ncbi:MAG: asparagine--tRNA ligase [Oscillospiraceae bacterium]|jgi:asparaginyl-tRNA synthetase|nr:asparagine--tRNA ligase [Oscillospiraceae bacterium]
MSATTAPSVKEIFRAPEQYQEVALNGWLRTVRDMKNIAFLELNDGSIVKNAQLVADESLPNFREAASLGVGAAVRIKGLVKPTPEARQPFEIKLTELTVEGECPPDYPLQKKRHSFEYLRSIAHLRPRTNTLGAVFRVRSETAYAIHTFFHDRGFVYAHTPVITASDGEGAGEMFRVTTLPPGETDFSKDFFGKYTGLTVTGQLEAETFAQTFGKTYTFGPTFRAEHSNTPRHAAEFWMIEPEIAFADLFDDMRLAEDMIKFVVGTLLKNCAEELAFFNQFIDGTLLERLNALVSAQFARMTYTDAITQLEKARAQFTFPVQWGCDIATEFERYLTETVVGGPVFIYDYPKEIKAFYMRLNDDGKTVAATDLLVPAVGELIGGSQREERLDVLLRRIGECGLKREDYEWYLDLRKYGSTAHAGFGIGFERLIMYVTGMQNIRDVIPFPRTTGSAEF